MNTKRTWIEFEAYGPIWQPGFSARKDGRITEDDWPAGWMESDEADLMWLERYMENLPDLSGVTDWAAMKVTEETSSESVVEQHYSQTRTVTVRTERTVKAWENEDEAREMYDQCHGFYEYEAADA